MSFSDFQWLSISNRWFSPLSTLPFTPSSRPIFGDVRRCSAIFGDIIRASIHDRDTIHIFRSSTKLLLWSSNDNSITNGGRERPYLKAMPSLHSLIQHSELLVLLVELSSTRYLRDIVTTPILISSIILLCNFTLPHTMSNQSEGFVSNIWAHYLQANTTWPLPGCTGQQSPNPSMMRPC